MRDMGQAPAGGGSTFGIGLGQAAGAAAGGIFGLIGQRARMRRQHANQKELMEQQYLNQRQLNLQGHQLQMDMWNKTNYPAQMAMLKEAGLNPALMYGMSGGGGTTTGSQGGGSAAGGQAGMLDIGSALAAAKLSAETKLLEAQKNNIDKNTEKQEGEIENIEADTILKGEQSKKFQAEIDKLTSDIKLNEALGITEETKQELNKALKSLNNQQTQNLIKELELTKQDIKYLQDNGLSRQSPMLMKTIKYLSDKTNFTEKQIITAVASAYGMGMLGKFVGDVAGAAGKIPGPKPKKIGY